MESKTQGKIRISISDHQSHVSSTVHETRYFLVTRCSDPTEDGWTKVMRSLRNLPSTVNHGMTYSSKISFNPSHSHSCRFQSSLYDTEHGQNEMVTSNGSSPVGYRSGMVKMITRSSSESELCSLEESLHVHYGIAYFCPNLVYHATSLFRYIKIIRVQLL
jgi:hypothetical protein